MDGAVENLKEHPSHTIVRMISELVGEEGAAITINAVNPDPNDKDNHSIDAVAYWTGWFERRFKGESLIQCLARSIQAKAEYIPGPSRAVSPGSISRLFHVDGLENAIILTSKASERIYCVVPDYPSGDGVEIIFAVYSKEDETGDYELVNAGLDNMEEVFKCCAEDDFAAQQLAKEE